MGFAMENELVSIELEATCPFNTWDSFCIGNG